MKIPITYYNSLDAAYAPLSQYNGILVRVGDQLYVLEVLNAKD